MGINGQNVFNGAKVPEYIDIIEDDGNNNNGVSREVLLKENRIKKQKAIYREDGSRCGKTERALNTTNGFLDPLRNKNNYRLGTFSIVL